MSKKPIFKVGDVVVVRDWDDMESEFGLYKSGNIKVPFSFTDTMRPLCGREIEIIGVETRFDGIISYQLGGVSWSISEQMLRPVADSQIEIKYSFDEFLMSEEDQHEG